MLDCLRDVTGARSAHLLDTQGATLARSTATGLPPTTSQSLTIRATPKLWLTFDFAEEQADDRRRAEKRQSSIAAIVRDWVHRAEAAPACSTREAMLGAAMEHNDCGIVALDAQHRVLFSNAAAQAILAERDGIELRRDVPRPTSYYHAVRFQEALDSIMAPPLFRGRPRAMVLLLKRTLHERALIAVLAPLSVEGAGPGAIIYLLRPEGSVTRGLDTICQLHGLSPVETHLVGHLMAGLTVAEAAAAMRVKADTARAYLKQVFVKTDTHRQSELVQLMLRYQRAVRGDFTFFPG